MTSPPSPPSRRRRRIVITVAVLVLGLGWWYWPRGDARFVGKWDSASVHLTIHYEFRANGTGTVVYETFDAKVASRLTWHGADKELVICIYAPLAKLFHDPARLAEAVLGHEFRYTIDSYSPSELVLSTTSTFRGEQLPFYETLSRVPDCTQRSLWQSHRPHPTQDVGERPGWIILGGRGPSVRSAMRISSSENNEPFISGAPCIGVGDHCC
jgi:hypothetical protein